MLQRWRCQPLKFTTKCLLSSQGPFPTMPFLWGFTVDSHSEDTALQHYIKSLNLSNKTEIIQRKSHIAETFWLVPGPAAKLLQVFGLWEITSLPITIRLLAPKIPCKRETTNPYMDDRLKGSDCEILTRKSPLQILNSLLLVVMARNSRIAFPENRTGPSFEKEAIM